MSIKYITISGEALRTLGTRRTELFNNTLKDKKIISVELEISTISFDNIFKVAYEDNNITDDDWQQCKQDKLIEEAESAMRDEEEVI